jgi:hypothetical protein
MLEQYDKKEITIDLNKPKVSHIDRNNFVYIKELYRVIDLIKDRVNDIKESSQNYTTKEAFERYRMHDAILIDGKRGSGKTTFLLNVKEVIDKDREVNVKILDSIDPNQLDEKSNILLILLAHIYTELLNEIQSRPDRNYTKKDKYKKLTTMLHNLTSAISATQERNYEDDYHKLYNLHQSLIIDETLHDFFSQVCDFFGVDALILPIDDIDMDFIHGYKVIDSIRKYLSTPKIIPIISIDTNQIYAIIKKVHYQYFRYLPHASKKDIKEEHELGFLKSLPEEYIQKILMPTRKIVLPDMYELFKIHVKGKRKIYFSYISNKLDKNSLKFNIMMDELLKGYINILFGNYETIREINNIDNFSILNYLKDKSFRSLFDDMISFLNGLYYRDNKYKYTTKDIKIRLIPLYITHFDTKYDSTIWFWNKYISLLRDKIEIYIKEHIHNERYESRFYVDISKYILFIDSFNSDNIQSHEQIYVRLHMQDFFIKSINIDVSKDGDNISRFENIRKEIDISGVIELLSRIMLPVYIFETLINEEIIDIFKYNLNELKFFGRDNSNTLRDTMFHLSTSILRYYNEKIFMSEANIDNKKIIGIFLDKKYEEIFGEYAVFIERYVNFKTDKIIYFLSPLKFYSIMPHYFKAIKDDRIEDSRALIEKFTKEYNPDVQGIYGLAYPLFNKDDISFYVNNSSLGIITIDKFSKDLVKNILLISVKHYDEEFIKKISKSELPQYRQFLNKNVNAYKTIYFNHLILFLVKKIDNKRFDEFKLDLRYITKGTSNDDFDKYKTKETYFADNIKKILIKIDNSEKFRDKYGSIEPFLYKLYLSLLKNHTYQSSYYLIKNDEFDIEKYIQRYIDEVNSGDNESLKRDLQDGINQFKELNNLKENLDYFYAEGDYLSNPDKKRERQSKVIEEYKKRCEDGRGMKDVIYSIAKDIYKYTGKRKYKNVPDWIVL